MRTHSWRAFQLMAVAYPSWAERFDTAMIEAWGSLVEEIPGSVLTEAIGRLVKASRFPPSVAEIHELARGLGHDQRFAVRTMSELHAAAKRGGV